MDDLNNSFLGVKAPENLPQPLVQHSVIQVIKLQMRSWLTFLEKKKKHTANSKQNQVKMSITRHTTILRFYLEALKFGIQLKAKKHFRNQY